MRILSLGVAAASLLFTAALPTTAVQASPQAPLVIGVDSLGDRPALEPVQYFYGGRNYCWYDGGWHGPGWYWCGYAWRGGYGWGGGYGWRGWHGGGGVWHGGHGGWHGGGGGWHGGGHGGGGWHGGGGGHGGGEHHH